MLRLNVMMRLSLILLLCLGIRFVLPWLSYNAVEHDPWHGHVVLGATSAAEWAHALVAHKHGDNQAHTHEPVQGEYRSGHFGEVLQVIPVPGSFDSLSSLFWMGDAILFLLLSLLPALIITMAWRTFSPIRLPICMALPPPIPPPR